ncbi:MAG TPA: GlxA family transcriptional regulator [Hypericibacter adhaerens]|jgi:transcriptional regulator GlxA family with amidase domain|uniref:HTH-type transcriptional regulator CdhR n=1 Tax=Hypericibacter adhaerens TaxID=2602016 RepID=A0A5J6MW98_9PROT|nr:GlxA family transcriptional regulator [Hypericibacter adhaerens]QEX21982.1 HTH-type transcriptional regulator CdhR [Hypericibacter adhaerens]HWA45055.1 GlxA family transcriptional regulator [Hypericibacter adhaerens]
MRKRLSAKVSVAPFHVGVVLTPGFSLMAFASTVEPLRGANLIQGDVLYRWSHLSPEGGMVASGGRLEVKTQPLPKPADADLDMIVVCGGMGSDSYRHPKLTAFLRQMMRRDVMIGSVSTASFILAEAGLLDHRRCTVHWDYIEAFQEAFPQIDVINELFVIDGNVFTCAGGTAAMDVMLQFIRQRQGDLFASQVSDQFIYGTIRQPRDAQRMTLRNRLGVSQPALVKAIEIMESAVEAPLRSPDIARRVGVSTRQLERLFTRYLSCTPSQHYIRLRLEKARKLLRHSTLSVLEVGVASGFTSASHFARAYRQHFKRVPSADRTPETVPFLAEEREGPPRRKPRS